MTDRPSNGQGKPLNQRDDSGQDALPTAVSLPGAPPARLDRANLSAPGLLERANLSDAWLDKANLATAKNLTQQHLDSARGDDETKLPTRRQRPAH